MTVSTAHSRRRLPVIVSAGLGLVVTAVVLPCSTASAAPTRYEAEVAPATCDGTIDSNWSGYSGTGFCNTNNAVGVAAQFTVNASAAGTATVAVRVANGTTASRSANVIVNGSTVQTTSFEGTGAWSTWATKTLTVSVKSGSNTIRLAATSSAGLPNIDYLDVEVGGTAPPPPSGGPVGWASVNASGQNGTTGGAGGPTVTVSTTDQLLDAINTVGPLVIRVQGTISITSKQGVRPNKTIIGVGTSAVIHGGGLDFYRSYNVIVRNIRFTNAEDDAINVGQESHHIWIDHNEFVSPVDGAVDIVRQADYVTVSWNWFRGTDKSMLIGHSDGASTDIGHLKATIHHNFFDGSRQRHPRIRFGEPVHVFNNYYRGNELYGIASTENAGALVEGNYFENVPFPCYSASGYADSGPGRLVERNNIFLNSGRCETAGSVAAPSYPYTVDRPADVPAIVRGGAGIGKI